MELATNLQKWCKETWNNNCESDRKRDKCKAYGAAFISGAIDGAVIAYPLLLTSCFVAGRKLKKLRELNK